MSNNNVVQSIDEGEGEGTESGVTKTDINSLMPEVSGVLSTARHRVHGGPASVLRDDTLVDQGGMQTTLREAARFGLVRKDANGQYHDLGAASEAQWSN